MKDEEEGRGVWRGECMCQGGGEGVRCMLRQGVLNN